MRVCPEPREAPPYNLLLICVNPTSFYTNKGDIFLTGIGSYEQISNGTEKQVN